MRPLFLSTQMTRSQETTGAQVALRPGRKGRRKQESVTQIVKFSGFRVSVSPLETQDKAGLKQRRNSQLTTWYRCRTRAPCARAPEIGGLGECAHSQALCSIRSWCPGVLVSWT